VKARLALVLVLAAAAATLWHSLWVGSVTDDAGIALAYARTFASGQGLRLGPLSPRVEGYSDPLWVLWLALGYALRIGGPRFAQISGAACGALAVLLTGLIPSRAEGRAPRPLDAVAPAVLACDTTYNFWCGAGLETGAFALALAAGMLLLARGSRWSFVPAGLLAVIRPEGALYVLLLAPLAPRNLPPSNLLPAARGWVGFLSRRSDILRWLLLAALPALGWLVFRRLYYAEWLPNSWFAKRYWNYGGFWYLNSWFLEDPWHWALYLAPLALLARSTRRAASLAAAACAAAVVFILVSRGDWMGEHRFAAHALPAAALAAGLVPCALAQLFGHRDRDVGWVSALVLIAAALLAARIRSPERRRGPELPLSYVEDQGRWFRAAAHRLGLARPRIAHFDLGGVALQSGGEVIDLAGLADLYIGRVGYQNQQAVRDYVFEVVKPEMLNIHGPCQYLRDDKRLQRDYLWSATGPWGENWIRKTLELDGLDDRCPAGRIPTSQQLAELLSRASELAAPDLWLCGRDHLPESGLPDVRPLAAWFAAQGLADSERRRARDLLNAAVTLDPLQTRAAKRLLELRLSH